MDAPDPKLQRRVAALLHKRPAAWRRAHGGYTPAQRWVVTFDDGTSCFVKSGAGLSNAPIDEWLRSEYYVYSNLRADFLPRLLAWDDDGVQPVLILEDLSSAFWPPPWSPQRVEAVPRMLAAFPAAASLELPAATQSDPDLLQHWREVEDHPEPFLSLGLASRAWLDAGLPVLVRAAASAVFDGEDLLHLDVRSDNLCFDGNRTLLIDWNFACRGDREADLAFWAPSLHSEGGPPPEEILPDAPEWAAVVSGFFACRAGLPAVPTAPRVRHVQLQQLRSALPWAVRALGLPPLDGPHSP